MADSNARTFYRFECGLCFATKQASDDNKLLGRQQAAPAVWDSNQDQTLFQCDVCSSLFQSMETFKAHHCASSTTPTNNLAVNDQCRCCNKISTVSIFFWNRAATLQLINCYKAFNNKLKTGKMKKKPVWEDIAFTLQRQEYRVTAEQMAGRWKSMMWAYNTCKDHNNKSETDRKGYEFEDEIDEICGTDPNIVPLYVQHTVQPSQSNNTPLPATAGSSTSTNEEDESDVIPVEPPKKRQKTNQKNEIVSILKYSLMTRRQNGKEEKPLTGRNVCCGKPN